MNLQSLTICIIIIIIGNAKCDETKHYIIFNTTASKADHVLGQQFKQRIYKMVDSVPWHAHVKAWVDVGLIVAEKPMTKLMDVANELGEHTDYGEWRQALWRKVGDKVVIYSKKKLKSFLVYVNTHLMGAYRKILKSRKEQMTILNLNYEENEGDYSYAGEKSAYF